LFNLKELFGTQININSKVGEEKFIRVETLDVNIVGRDALGTP